MNRSEDLIYPGRNVAFQVGLYFWPAKPGIPAGSYFNLSTVRLFPGGERFAGQSEDERMNDAVDAFARSIFADGDSSFTRSDCTNPSSPGTGTNRADDGSSWHSGRRRTAVLTRGHTTTIA